ncbi:hypothetical protein AMAG_01623 [Allomyces macrogynus ATCC 38327]|uniref:ABC transporter domain-containing protein n=1 Tax=Allomyces macrogynus (strain ATCC 38327) TaxID=578462 RepID=A0A0L0S051_ALLM3|nr:hypothetical protein AMAG_01623 [Allomyces macrogynus ATCC 38327]|eukprot:KNE55746.1 hypothetical protein AMAG_01623 [Allomyces macrogynus ATCC 38327]
MAAPRTSPLRVRSVASIDAVSPLTELAAAPPSQRDPICPPCFNCMLPAFPCRNEGQCSSSTGRCLCPAGFGGDDCTEPLCGALPDGNINRPIRTAPNAPCACSDGWTGINCNVCTRDSVCDALVPTGQNGTCYSGALAVTRNHHQCRVTNKKIVAMLKEQVPEVTMFCNATGASPDNRPTPDATGRCGFQFWAGGVESFYCDLDHCVPQTNPLTNATSYDCAHIQCKCVPDRMLCGLAGSVDITEFLDELVRGPGRLVCSDQSANGERSCEFTEPAMNELISDVFGDTSITLACTSGECMHVSQVPGYTRPEHPGPGGASPIVFALLTTVALLVVAALSFAVWRRHRDAAQAARRRRNGDGYSALTQDELDKLMADHVPATLTFRDIRYRIPRTPGAARRRRAQSARRSPTPEGGEQEILHGVHGLVRPGQVLAIMGGSGAGKSTCLDILARRTKTGVIKGELLVNGRVLDRHEFRTMVGFVDQEDMLMPTLTVEETILYSALLRLPKDMSYEAKWNRVRETMIELGISHIAKSQIGDATTRGISGGEKRRVSIACELVTSPSILFLDEPTSGLDSYNAHNVVECLVQLARNYNRTVIFTIHQPRSDIFTMFDQLLLLSKGHMMYSGPALAAGNHFANLGFPCPAGYNIADFLIDLTMGPGGGRTSSARSGGNGGDADASASSDTLDQSGSADAVPLLHGANDDENVIGPMRPSSPVLPANSDVSSESDEYWENQLGAGPGTPLRNAGNPPNGRAGSPGSGNPLDERSRRLAQLFLDSPAGRGLDESVAVAAAMSPMAATPLMATPLLGNLAGPASSSPAAPMEPLTAPVPGTMSLTRRIRTLADQRAPLTTQFQILGERTLKNLYRNPYLLLTHYAMAVIVALVCGVLFWHVQDDIAGFQNRMGCFFFICALFGFSGLTSLQTFAAERILFVRERANGYYSPVTYFAAKVLCDVVPLRVVPPLLLGCIVYPMVGLVDAYPVLLKFLLVLVLFNITAAAVCLLISLAVRETAVASLIACLVMLFAMLFGGLLLNRDSIAPGLQWLQPLSFFNAALEALVVNELRDLQLTEIKYGLQIDVPAAVILSTFGFNARAYWTDVYKLTGMSVGCLVAGYVVLHTYVKERR